MTPEILRTHLIYDPETGELTHRNTHASKPRVAHRKRPRKTVKVLGKTISAHRAAWAVHYGVLPTGEIDHINGDEADNRIANLRDVPKAMNQQNKRRPRMDNKVGLLGVSWHERAKKWRAQITVDGSRKYLGLFSTPEEAHEAYLTAKRELHPGNTI